MGFLQKDKGGYWYFKDPVRTKSGHPLHMVYWDFPALSFYSIMWIIQANPLHIINKFVIVFIPLNWDHIRPIDYIYDLF